MSSTVPAMATEAKSRPRIRGAPTKTAIASTTAPAIAVNCKIRPSASVVFQRGGDARARARVRHVVPLARSQCIARYAHDDDGERSRRARAPGLPRDDDAHDSRYATRGDRGRYHAHRRRAPTAYARRRTPRRAAPPSGNCDGGALRCASAAFSTRSYAPGDRRRLSRRRALRSPRRSRSSRSLPSNRCDTDRSRSRR